MTGHITSKMSSGQNVCSPLVLIPVNKECESYTKHEQFPTWSYSAQVTTPWHLTIIVFI